MCTSIEPRGSNSGVIVDDRLYDTGPFQLALDMIRPTGFEPATALLKVMSSTLELRTISVPKMRFELIRFSLTKRTQYRVMRLGRLVPSIIRYFRVGTNLASLPQMLRITPPLVLPPNG